MATLTLTAPGVAVTDAVSGIPEMDTGTLVASEEENESVSKSWLLAEGMVGESEEGREEMLLLIDIEMDDNSDTMMLSDDVTMTSSEETIAVVGDRSRVDEVGDGSMERRGEGVGTSNCSITEEERVGEMRFVGEGETAVTSGAVLELNGRRMVKTGDAESVGTSDSLTVVMDEPPAISLADSCRMDGVVAESALVLVAEVGADEGVGIKVNSLVLDKMLGAKVNCVVVKNGRSRSTVVETSTAGVAMVTIELVADVAMKKNSESELEGGSRREVPDGDGEVGVVSGRDVSAKVL